MLSNAACQRFVSARESKAGTSKPNIDTEASSKQKEEDDDTDSSATQDR
jgi:hypothetical protein